MKNIQKLFLSIQLNGVSKDQVAISPSAICTVQDDLLVYELPCDPTQITTVKVSLLNKSNPQDHLIIKNINYGGVDLLNLDSFGIYQVNGTKVQGTHGYMDRIGSYCFKIRYAPQVHHYMSYLLEKFG